MRFGVRRLSIRGRISARTSWKRHVRHSMGFKAPRGMGLFTNPKKAIYNRAYNRTTVSVDDLLKPARASSGASYSGSNAAGEAFAIGIVTVGIALAFLMWLGLSFKWAMILIVGGGIHAVAGPAGVVLTLIIIGVIASYLS